MIPTDFDAEDLFTQLPTPGLIIALDGKIVAANKLAFSLFEVDTSFDGLSVLDLLTQPERARLNPLVWMEKWASAKHAPEADYVYLTCRTQKDEEKQLSVRVARLAKKETYYLVLLTDITISEARLRAERLAHRVAARILAISADAVITANGALKITQINHSAETLFGYSASELLGKPLDILMPKRFRQQHIKSMKAFAQDNSPSRLMGERSVVSGLRKDGVEIPLEASITRLTIDKQTIFSAHVRELPANQAPECPK